MTRLRPRPSVSGARRSKTRVLALALALGSLASGTAFAGHHIRVVRSLFLERGHSIEPYALTRTRTGGYVIAGTMGGPWALRVSRKGRVVWRYRLPFNAVQRGQMSVDSRYTGAVTLPDDSTLLCGFGDFSPRSNPDLRGILTHISPHSRVLSTQTLYPNNNRHYVLNYLNRCVRWGRGVAVMGFTSHVWGHSIPRHDQSYFWLLKLNGQGKTEWEKLMPTSIGIPAPSDMEMEVLTNHDLVMATGSTKITLIAPDGTIEAQRTFPFVTMVPSTRPERAVHVLTGGKHVTPARLTLGDHLQDTHVTEVSGHTATIGYKKIYLLPDGALALFGQTAPRSTKFENTIANALGPMMMLLGIDFLHEPSPDGIQWVSPHMNRDQIFKFRRWGFPWIADAVPTGTPGEFATIRSVGPLHNPQDTQQLGIILAIVRIR